MCLLPRFTWSDRPEKALAHFVLMLSISTYNVCHTKLLLGACKMFILLVFVMSFHLQAWIGVWHTVALNLNNSRRPPLDRAAVMDRDLCCQVTFPSLRDYLRAVGLLRGSCCFAIRSGMPVWPCVKRVIVKFVVPPFAEFKVANEWGASMTLLSKKYLQDKQILQQTRSNEIAMATTDGNR